MRKPKRQKVEFCEGCIKGQIRQSVDWIARYGGEEFVVVLPETDLAGGCAAAERLRRAFEIKSVPTDRGPLSVTASFGVACLEPGEEGDAAVDALEGCDRWASRAVAGSPAAPRSRSACPRPVLHPLRRSVRRP